MKAARTRARHQAPLLRLPLLEDLYSVQVALMQLADAIAYREIDPQHARLLTTVLRLAMQNLKSKAWDRPSRFQLAETEAAPTTWDTFEQELDLPPDLDLSLDPEAVFPLNGEQLTGAPLNPSVGLSGRESAATPPIPGAGMSGNDDPFRTRVGQILRDAETPVPGTPAHITADDVEILDVYEREGNEAMMQVIAEQQRNRHRRERRARRLYYEEVARNRNIQSAAHKLLQDQHTGASPEQEPRVSISEEVAKVGAALTRKPPLRQESAPRQNASGSKA